MRNDTGKGLARSSMSHPVTHPPNGSCHFEPNLFPYHFSFLVHSTHIYLPIKMEQTECSETSAYKLQTPGNYPEESIQQLSVSFPLKMGPLRFIETQMNEDHNHRAVNIWILHKHKPDCCFIPRRDKLPANLHSYNYDCLIIARSDQNQLHRAFSYLNSKQLINNQIMWITEDWMQGVAGENSRSETIGMTEFDMYQIMHFSIQ